MKRRRGLRSAGKIWLQISSVIESLTDVRGRINPISGSKDGRQSMKIRAHGKVVVFCINDGYFLI
jgi:hypothetical protein